LPTHRFKERYFVKLSRNPWLGKKILVYYTLGNLDPSLLGKHCEARLRTNFVDQGLCRSNLTSCGGYKLWYQTIKVTSCASNPI